MIDEDACTWSAHTSARAASHLSVRSYIPAHIPGEMADSTPPEEWPLFADFSVPWCANYPTLQRSLGYALDAPVVRYGNPPPNPRWHVCMERSGAIAPFMGRHRGVCRG
jgi:hypothetical protein